MVGGGSRGWVGGGGGGLATWKVAEGGQRLGTPGQEILFSPAAVRDRLSSEDDVSVAPTTPRPGPLDTRACKD